MSLVRPAQLALAALPLLAGCASLGAWSPWGAGTPQASESAPLADAEFGRLASELVQLRDQQAHFAATLPRVQDPATRMLHVRNINSLADRIQSLESRLRAAGRPTS